MLPAPKLSALTGAQVSVKYENLQVTNSFKERGALNKLASLSAAERARGVIAMSAGNHAQAVAYHAQRLEHPGDHRDAGDDAVREGRGDRGLRRRTSCCTARRLPTRRCAPRRSPRSASSSGCIPMTIQRVIAGQGTDRARNAGGCARSRRAGDPDRRRRADRRQRDRGARRSSRQSRSSASNARSIPSMCNALKGEHRPVGGATLAEGIAVKNVGKLTEPVVRELVSDVLLVEEAHLERAVNAFLTHAEDDGGRRGRGGARGAAREPERFAGRRVGLILCGGNIDPRILSSIMFRELERESRVVSFRLTIPDRPGVLGVIATRLRAARREHPGGRAPPPVPRRAGEGREARRDGRDARCRARGRDFPRARQPTAMRRCASMRVRRWSEGYCPVG